MKQDHPNRHGKNGNRTIGSLWITFKKFKHQDAFSSWGPPYPQLDRFTFFYFPFFLFIYLFILFIFYLFSFFFYFYPNFFLSYPLQVFKLARIFYSFFTFFQALTFAQTALQVFSLVGSFTFTRNKKMRCDEQCYDLF